MYLARFVLRPEAEHELLEAQTWYESKALGHGFEFARAADAAVASALRNPFGHLRIEEGFRPVLFRKFPYKLIYLPNESPRTPNSAIHP